MEDENIDEEIDESEVVAKVYPINENWPEEVKRQVEQINKMSTMLNNAGSDPVEGEEMADEEDDSVEEKPIEDAPEVSEDENETFDSIF